jgi:hypothetical protein
VGIDFEEGERFFGIPGKKLGIRAAWAKAGWRVEAPLCEPPYLSQMDRLARLNREGLWLPRLNAMGFAHNNCGGACSKGGHGHWERMLRIFPERYAYSEGREESIRAELGDVSMLTDRRGGDGKKPLTLAALRERKLTVEERADMGGCSCFFGDEP